MNEAADLRHDDQAGPARGPASGLALVIFDSASTPYTVQHSAACPTASRDRRIALLLSVSRITLSTATQDLRFPTWPRVSPTVA